MLDEVGDVVGQAEEVLFEGVRACLAGHRQLAGVVVVTEGAETFD